VAKAWIAILGFVAVGACKGRGSEPDKQPPSAVGDKPEPATAGSAVEDNDQMVQVSADESKEHGLPPIGMRVDATGTNLSLLKFPEPDKYLIASGPPGGPLLAIVWTTEEHESDAAAVERAVRKLFSNEWQKPLEIGAAGTVTLAGASRPALAFTTGQSLRYTGWCGTLVTAKAGSILVTFGITPNAGAKPACAEVLAEPNLAAFARTFSVQ
jgi:hypothetical protein